MRALISAEKPEVVPGDLLAEVSGLWCLATEADDTPGGARRIPVSVLSDFVNRDSAMWDTPDSATTGRRELEAMIQRWLDDLNAEVDVTHSVPRHGVIPSKSSRKGLLQVQMERTRKGRGR